MNLTTRLVPLLLVACATPPGDAPAPAPVDPPGPGDEAAPGGDAPESNGAPDGARALAVSARLGPLGAYGPPVAAATTCLDSDSGGVGGSLSPTVLRVAMKRFTLLGAAGTPDADLLALSDPSLAAEVDVTAAGADLGLSDAPPGSYDGVEIELYWTGFDLPLSLDGLPAAATWPVRTWYTDVSPVQRRDLTIQVEGVTGLPDGAYWVSEEQGLLVSTEPVDIADTGIPYDTGGADTGLPPEVPEAGVAPEDRLRAQDDPAFWDADPVVVSSRDGGALGWDVSGGTLVVAAGGTAAVEVVFDPTDLVRWWEAHEEGDISTADGVYTWGMDCGLHLSVPLMSVTAP